MRDSIQLDQYVLQPLVKGSNSQISVLTLDPDSPPFQTWNAQQSCFDDSLDDLKNEIDFFSIDSADQFKNGFHFNNSAMNTTTGSHLNNTQNNNQQKNRGINFSNSNSLNYHCNQSINPLLLLNSKSDIYPQNNINNHGNNNYNKSPAESNNYMNSPLIQFNYVNNPSPNLQQINNNVFFLPPSQLTEQEQQKLKQDFYENNFKNKNNNIKNKQSQSYPIKQQIPSFQKSNSAAFPIGPQQQQAARTAPQQNQQPLNNLQYPPHIYFQSLQEHQQQQQQQFFFFQQDESQVSLPSPQNTPTTPVNMTKGNSQSFMSPQLTSYQPFLSPQLRSQQEGMINGGYFMQQNNEQNSNQKGGQNQSIYHVLQANSFQIQQQNQQFIPNFYLSKDQLNANSQNPPYIQQQYLQQSQQQLLQNQLIYQQKSEKINNSQYQFPPNYIQESNKTEQINTNNSNINIPTINCSNPNQFNTTSSNTTPQNINNHSLNSNQISNNTYSPFSTPNDNYILQQIEIQIDQITTPLPQISKDISMTYNINNNNINNNNINNNNNNATTPNMQQRNKSLSSQLDQQQQRQKKISFQDQSFPDLKLSKTSSRLSNQAQNKKQLAKKQSLKRGSVDRGMVSSTSSQQRQNKKCVEKHCSGVGYQHYQPTSPINSSINPHRTLIIKQIMHHEQSQHDKNCFNLYNEYTLQSNLYHENILQPIQFQLVKDVHDHPHTKGGCYIIYPKAMSDMYDYCLAPQTPYVDIEEIRKMMRQISSALHYIHETKKIVHCDIKPENIFKLAKDHFVLADFGLAHYIQTESNTFNNTKKAQIESQNNATQISQTNISTNSSNTQQNQIIAPIQTNKSILSDQNEDIHLSVISDNDQIKQNQATKNDSNKISNSDFPITKCTFDNQCETSEGQTLDCTSQEQMQQIIDSQSSSSSSSSLDNLSKASQDFKLKSCFHCYPQNLPDYVYANINSRPRQEESDDEINHDKYDNDVTQDCDEDSEIEDENSVNENKKEFEIINQDLNEIDDDEEEDIYDEEDNGNKEEEEDSCLHQETLQSMNLCDQFSFKTRQSDYFSPEIIKYQTETQNGVSKKEQSNNNIDYIDEKKADIFALGMTLFVCLFKSYPYQQTCCLEDPLYKYLGQSDKKLREQFWYKFVKNLEHYANAFDDSRVHELKDLIEKMLHPNASQRISINEVISHPWLSTSS